MGKPVLYFAVIVPAHAARLHRHLIVALHGHQIVQAVAFLTVIVVLLQTYCFFFVFDKAVWGEKREIHPSLSIRYIAFLLFLTNVRCG